MWEQIRVNKRNSVVLLGVMAAVLTGLGFLLGYAFGGGPEAGWTGVFIATCVWLVMMLVSLFGGDQILLASSRATPVTENVHPQLFNVVEEMTIAANLPKIPKIYIINDPAPNAFATGRNPENASVAVTAGLLGRLNRDELQGVIAHEISHIVHRDILFVTMAGVMLGAIVLLSQVFARGMFYSAMGGRRYSSRSQGGGGGQALVMVLALIGAILAPLFAQILYFSLSRKREYLADAGAVRLTRYPEGLASALEKIAGSTINMESANKVTAPMYIANPFRGSHAAHLFSTHPPIDERVRVLRNMAHGAGFKDYNSAFEQVTHRGGVIPRSAVQADETVALRDAAKSPGPGGVKNPQRHIGDIMRKVNGFSFIPCACGVQLKLPANYTHPTVQCPRCKRTHNV
jgi:heat shock protein HtpX